MLHNIGILIWIIIKILVIVVPLLISVAYLTYAERKVIGYIQVRIGEQGRFKRLATAVC